MRDRARPPEALERQRGNAVPSRGVTGRAEGGRDAAVDAVGNLQRLAGNSAVTELLKGHPTAVQRAGPAASPSATPDAGAAVSTADPAIDGLDLQSDVSDAARELKKAVPAVVFTSGRRSLQHDSSLVAGHIVANRHYVDIFVNSRPKRLIKAWVDAHPNATVAEVTDGIVGILEPMDDTERSYWSLHLGGRAFDVDSGSCTLAEVKTIFPQAFSEEGHWHVQFPTHWAKK
ncbi:MAG: hypothetical protein ABI401_15505 [Candidatus Dormibacter sp.]